MYYCNVLITMIAVSLNCEKDYKRSEKDYKRRKKRADLVRLGW